MSDQNHGLDAGLIWRDQPEERVPVNLEQVVNRRAQELSSRTRAEILMSVGSALLLVGVVAWRLEIGREGRLEFGLAAAVAWVLISLYAFRRRVFWRASARRDAVAATGLEYYRKELERRRSHLRNVWLWHGPLLLALIILIRVLTGRVNIAYRPVRNALPLLVLLAAWVGSGIRRRLVQARSLQREIDELIAFGDGSNRREM